MRKDKIDLNKALEYGLIDIEAISSQVEMLEAKRILRNHTLSIWRGQNGNWYTKIHVNGKKKLVKRKTKKDIENFIIDHYRSDTSEYTLEAIFKKWIAQKDRYNEICKGTIDRYTNDFYRFFGEDKNVSIMTFDEDLLEDFVRSKIADLKLSAKSYSNMKTLLMGMFRYAKKHGFTDVSISSFFGDLGLSRKVFNNRRKIAAEQVFSDEEAQQIIDYLVKHPAVDNLGVALAFYTGVRESELSALHFSDLNGNRLHVQRQAVRYKSDKKHVVVHEIVDRTKTEAGDRMVILTDEALRIIEMIRELNHDSDLMMYSGGKRVCITAYNHRLYRACDQCGIARRSMHKIRKTYATMLIDNDVDDSLIMEQMGHSDITTTRKYYYYSRADDKSKERQIRGAIHY